MASEIKLKPCPFCGSQETGVYYDTGRHYVSCECGARGPSADTDEVAIAYWNRRSVNE